MFNPGEGELRQSGLFDFHTPRWSFRGLSQVESTFNALMMKAGFISLVIRREKKRGQDMYDGLFGIICLPQLIQTPIFFKEIRTIEELKAAILKVCEQLKNENAEKLREPMVMLHEFPATEENPVSFSVVQNKLYLFVRSNAYLNYENFEVNTDVANETLYNRFYLNATWLGHYIETQKRFSSR